MRNKANLHIHTGISIHDVSRTVIAYSLEQRVTSGLKSNQMLPLTWHFLGTDAWVHMSDHVVNEISGGLGYMP